METKKCSKCQRDLPVSHFHKNGFDSQGRQKYRGYCKDCANNLEKARYQKKKNFIDSRKQRCQKCGDSRAYVLDFHHIDPCQKDDSVARLTSNTTKFERLEEEINKCVVLCANCHREFHYFNFLNSEFSIEEYLNPE